jgi:glycosyltransferase involved in cell wall biosynthesis
MQPINVLELCQVDGAGGGADRIVLRTASMADPARFNITACCLKRRKDATFDMHLRAGESGVDYVELPFRSKLDVSLLPALRRLIWNKRIHIVHAHGYKPVLLASQLARLEKVAVMCTCHGWTGHLLRERLLYYPAEKLLIRRFPLAIAVSSEIRDTLVRWGARPDRVRVVLNGVDPREFSPDMAIRKRVRSELGLKPGEVAIGAAGRLERQKRFDQFIECIALLLKKRLPVRAFIVGEGSLRQALEKQINRLGIGAACRLLGYQSAIKDFYQGLDALVQSSDYEGTPTVVVEGMALGIPVVATDVGGTKELASHNMHALIVRPRDPAALADAVEATLGDPRSTAERTANGRRRVETELSFESRTRQLSAAYEALAQSWRQQSARASWEHDDSHRALHGLSIAELPS